MKFGLSDNIYKEIKTVINKYSNKCTIRLFGSRARGDYKQNSDIDLAIFNIAPEEEFNIHNDLDKINMPYTIDIVFIRKDTKVELLNSINKDGVEF